MGKSELYPLPKRYDTGIAEPFIFGTIRYSDVFGHHESRFCRRVSFAAGEEGVTPAGSTYWNGFS